MTAQPQSNRGSESTTWDWRKVKVRVPAGGHEARVAKPRRWYSLPRWNGRKPLTIKVTYRGGGECWYEVHSRGCEGRFVGSTCLHDVMDEIYGDDRRSS